MMTSDDENASVAAIAKSVGDLDQSAKNEFWGLVRRTLVEVLGKSERDADTEIESLTERLDALSHDDALMIYHNSPIQVAANLAGVDGPLTAQQELAYDDIMNRGRPASERPTEKEVLRRPKDVSDFN
ncbi:hypothetical protein [Bradyrhizobium forestalis]|uniref:hypothetical protein n=1 Tax=Bradyrhizobium forestalis TaxID=1419263 RepID=UPI0011AF50E4|nr:hypothetical protein [Bradyrhizobium forestalis]